MTGSAGASVLGSTVGAGGAITQQAQLVRGRVMGAGEMQVGGLRVSGLSDNKMWSMAGVLSIGEDFGVGATLALNEVNARTQAVVTDHATVRAGASGVSLETRDDTRGVAIGAAGTGSTGGTGISAANGVILSRSAVDALITGQAEIVSAGDVSVRAKRSQELGGLAYQITIASSAGIGGALALAQDKGVTTALVQNSLVTADADVAVRAENNTKVVTSSAGAGYGGSFGVMGSVSLTFKSDTVSAKLDAATVSAGDSVLVEALNGGRVDSVGGGDESFFGVFDQALGTLAFGDSAAVGVTVSLIKTTSVVDAAIVNGSNVAAWQAPATAGGISTFGRAEGDADYLDRQILTRKGVAVVADTTTELNTFAFTGAGSGGASISAQMPFMLINDSVTASVEGSRNTLAVNSGKDVDVFAGNATKIKTISGTAAFGASVGIGALNEFFLIAKNTTAKIVGARVAAANDVTIQAVTPESLRSFSASAVGGIYTGIAGVNEVLVARSTTAAFAKNAALNAGNDIAIQAHAPRKIVQNAGTMGIGIAGIGASIIIVNASDSVVAETVSADRAANGVTLRAGRDIDVSAEVETLPNEFGNRIEGPSGSGFIEANQAVIGTGGGLVGVAGAGLFSDASQSVVARIGRNSDVAAGQDLSVRGYQYYGQDIWVATASGGYVGVGAAAVIGAVRSSVLAVIDDGASASAVRNLTVDAYGERSFNGGVVAGGGGAFSFQGSGILLTYGKRIHVDDDADSIEGGQEVIADVQADLNDDPFRHEDNPNTNKNEAYIIGAGDSILETLLGEVTSARQALDLNDSFNGTRSDTITTQVGAGAALSAGGDIAITTREGGELEILAGGAAGGAIAATHGVALVRRGTRLESLIGQGAALNSTQGAVTVSAVSDVDDGNPEAITGSSGLITSATGISDIRIGRALNVAVGQGAILTAKTAVTVQAEEISSTRAKVSAGVSGPIGSGVAVANAMRESTIDVAFIKGGPAPHISAPQINLIARRVGKVEADVDVLATGAIGVGATAAFARDTSVVTLDLANVVLRGGALNVDAANSGDVSADAKGDVGALGGTGANLATARKESTTTLRAGGANLDLFSVDILATDNITDAQGARGQVYASTRSTMIAAASLGGSSAKARNVSQVNATLNFARFDVAQNARIEARNETDLRYLSKGVNAGLVGFGLSFAEAKDQASARLDLNFYNTANIGQSFTAKSGGRSYLFGNSVAGNGGLITAFGSLLELEMDTVTELTLRGAGVVAKEIVLHADRGIEFESNADSLNVSLSGFGATRQTNDVNASTVLTLASDLTAERITVALDADFIKRAIDFNGTTGSFGGINATALTSRSTVLSDALIDVRPGVQIVQTSNAVNPSQDTGFVEIALRTDYDLTDRVKGDMGGLVNLPRLESTLLVGDRHDASKRSSGRIALDGVTIAANADVWITARTDAMLDSESYVRTYGAAGAGEGQAHAQLRHNNSIALDGGSIESRRGSIAVMIGEDRNGTQEIRQHAESRVYNRTSLPLQSNPDALAELSMTNSIVTNTSSRLRAAGDISLRASDGLTDPYAYGFAIDAYAEAAQEVRNFFGGLIGADDVSLGTESGTVNVSTLSGVNHYGTAEAGAYAAQRLTIDFADGVTAAAVNSADDLVITREGDIDYDLAFNVSITGRVEAYIADLRATQAEYNVGSDVYNVLGTQIDALEARLSYLGATGTGGVATDFLTIDDVQAVGGNIDLAGDYLVGAGTLRANGDAVIEVTNNTALSVDVTNAKIPFVDAGQVRYNGVQVASNADLAALGSNLIAGPINLTAAFALQANNTDVTPPHIDMWMNYIANGGPTSDLYVRGDVENLNGSVNLRTEDGSIYVFGGNINARSVVIDSGGDFFLAPSDPTTHITQDPSAIFGDLFAEQEAYQNAVYSYMNRNPDVTEDEAKAALRRPENGLIFAPIPNYVVPASEGSVQALGNIFIYADTLNINGLIRSGLTDWALDIDDSIDSVLDGLGAGRHEIYRPLRGQAVGSDPDSTNVEIIGLPVAQQANPPSVLPGQGHISGNVSVTYNGDTDELEIGAITTKGGYIELSGKIVSTGNGRIVATSGYGRAMVNSDSRRDLRFSRIDLGPQDGVS
ncbi:hypothetical protein, partial [Pseudorhodobacter sp.]|uniref:beta strand repeat-containing protein n=1 Tax=Pseudorhodobacter sp. TaxID=1934400 RepID=UPI0026470374